MITPQLSLAATDRGPPPSHTLPLLMDLIWQILLSAAIISVAIFLEILACVLFPVDGGSGSEWMILLALVPALVMLLPLAVLRASGSDDAFTESSRSRHWAEFFVSCIGSGMVGVPVLLLLKHTIRWEALALALTGVLLPLSAFGMALFCKRRDAEEGSRWAGF